MKNSALSPLISFTDMFTSAIESVKKGRLPDYEGLRKKFDLALVKKMGVISLPYQFWQGDPKINPSSSQLLWIAVLLEDNTALANVIGVIQKELEESLMASGVKISTEDFHLKIGGQIRHLLNDLLSMAPNSKFRKILDAKCHSLDSVFSF